MARQWTVIAVMLLTALLGARASAASVVAVSTTKADGLYGAGTIIDVTVQFSEAVTVGGTPSLLLETGAFDEPASYTAAGSTATTLDFRFTVAIGDRTSQLECVNRAALTLNGGSISAVSNGSPADLTLPILGTANTLSGSHRIVLDTDGKVATVKKIWSPSGDGKYGKNKSLIIDVQFTEPIAVTGSTPPTLELSAVDSTPTNATATLLSGQFTDTLSFTYTPLAGQGTNDLDVLAVVLASPSDIGGPDGDADFTTIPTGGAAGALNNSNNIVIDTVDPTIT
jgi:hypothetical protein